MQLRPSAKRGDARRQPTIEEFSHFVESRKLDYHDSRQWWEMTVIDRGFTDRDGKRIGNWKKALSRFCEAKWRKREAERT